MAEATGAFVVCALLIIAGRRHRPVRAVMDRIPQAVAAALLAGVLARFGLDAVLRCARAAAGGGDAGGLPGRAALVAALCRAGRAAGRHGGGRAQGRVHWAASTGLGHAGVHDAAVQRSVVGVALPLFVVTMASQNLPGVAAQRAAGYHAGVAGDHRHRPGHAGAGTVRRLRLNLAAITAAICMGREAHADPARATPRR
jgi:benzoate membrane transport protein